MQGKSEKPGKKLAFGDESECINMITVRYDWKTSDSR